MGTKVVPRPTARVLITNDDGRLLLFHCRTSPDRLDDLYWITPGGGVQTGETLADAAVRELREETGIVVTPDQLGGVIAYATGEWSASDTVFAAHDSFFWFRAGNPVIDSSGCEELENSLLLGHAWWSAAELAATEELVFPGGVDTLLRDLLAGRLPSTPIRLPWCSDEHD